MQSGSESDAGTEETDDIPLEELFGGEIDPDDIMGHVFLTSNLHSIPADYPEHYFRAAKHMTRTNIYFAARTTTFSGDYCRYCCVPFDCH